MALFHFHVTQISRGRGQSAMAAAAYRSGMRLYSKYYGESYDYTLKKGVVYSEILLPSHAPASFSDRETLWDSLEQAEKHPKAQLAYSFDIALQNELRMEENISLARAFVQENLVAKGMIADLAVHQPEKADGEQNPHFHVMCPIRPLTTTGEWGAKQRREYLLDDQGERIPDGKGGFRFNAVPTTDWGAPHTLEHWRKNWADMVNAVFEEKNLTCRIDHCSYEKSNIPLIPQTHEGPRVRSMERTGIPTEKAERNRFIARTNRTVTTLLTKLKQLRAWIAGVKESLITAETHHRSLTELVLEYYDHRDKAADSFVRGRRKAKLTNLKKKAETIRYMQEKGIHSASDLEHAITALSDRASSLEKTHEKMKARVSRLKRHLQNGKAIDETKEIFERSQKIFFSGARKKYLAEHATELKRYHAAMNYFKKLGIAYEADMKEEWKALLTAADHAGDDTFKEYEPIRAELKQLKDISKAVDFALSNTDSGGLSQITDSPEATVSELSTEKRSNRKRVSVRRKLEDNQQLNSREKMNPSDPERPYEVER